MSRSLCSKDLYCTFLRVTSQRYSRDEDDIVRGIGMLNFLGRQRQHPTFIHHIETT